MSALLIFCRECGRQVPSSQTREGLCIDCQVRRSVAELRDEHARLWRKRERYRNRNANVEQIGRQIARTEDRMAQRIRELVPNERDAVDHLRRELEAARGQRYTIKGV
jgi:predicted RNase H-like nuclease (RuvC/YqgF family)